MYKVNFDPAMIRLGSFQIRWYSVMYIVGFIITGFLLRKLAKEKFFRISIDKVDTFLFYNLIGMLLGARLVYVFVYNWSSYYANNPGAIFAVWQGGLSFHGAIIGFVAAGFLFAKRYKLHPLECYDAAVTAGTQGVFFGRIGNFINGELYGRPTDSFVGMIFPGGGPYPRHPSQLYEALFEGIVLFCILM